MSSIAPPKARPAAAAASTIFGLLLIGLAVVTVRDLAVTQGWTTGDTWTGAAIDQADGQTANGAVIAAGIILMIAGLWITYLAIKPARRTHESAPLDGDVWVTHSALTSLATRAAEDTHGVAGARTSARRSRIVVTVESDRPGVEADVEANIRTAIEGLSTKAVTVKTKKVTYDS